MATALCVLAAAVLVVALLVWRLRRASRTVETILREEHDLPQEPPEPSDEPHEVGPERRRPDPR
ncbi:hypothetical protein [Actinokineospora bangkokensis]|uniref:hypothetical protein n=1 Tax=Actinokineospora bangkokensis TaxID=1193682 RepID=UPI001177C775|nr:hypothetical protein [Actinokineospora bangkokensis]